MPWGADPREFDANLTHVKAFPGTLLITGEIPETESHVEVSWACEPAGAGPVSW
jgi:hypothetical protein